MSSQTNAWSAESICLRSSSLDAESIAVDIYERTCRTNFEQPGFIAVNVGNLIDSMKFRHFMIELKQEMALIHEARSQNTLAYLSAARFDQQETTRPHLDGGPEECFLMLGYEPSDVEAELEVLDYTKCAFDLGIDPKEFMVKHNPMFESGYELLQPYSTRIPCFSNGDFQIICINNSSAPFVDDEPAWQGTLHTAKILTPDESKRRIINSTMVASVPIGTADLVSKTEQEEFASTSSVKRKGYDKAHLEDD